MACDIAATIASTLREAGVCRTRIPYEPPEWLDASAVLVAQPRRHSFCLEVARCALLARPVYAGVGVFASHGFVGNAVMGAAMTKVSSLSHIRMASGNIARGGSIEIMVHPGRISRVGGDEEGGCGGGVGPDEFACSPDRVHELAVLCEYADAILGFIN